MQSKTRRNLSLFCLAGGWLLASVIAGCARPTQVDTEPAPLLFEGQVVTIVSPGEPVTGLLNRYALAWARKVGARVEILPVPGDGDLPAVQDASAWIIRPAEMPRWAADGKLTPVPAEYKATGGSYNWSGLLPLYREKLLRWAGEAYALPLLGDAPLCFFRADLFADARHQEAFKEKYRRDLVPPRTWHDVADIAEYFYSNRTPAKAAPSLPPLPAGAEELDYAFHAVAAPCTRRAIHQDEGRPVSDEELFSYHYNCKTGKPRIDHPGFVHALQLLQKLQQFQPAQASASPPQAFAEGQAVLCLAQASWIERFRTDLPAGSIGVCEVPGSARWFQFRDAKEQAAPAKGNHIPYQGAHGWLAVVPRAAPHGEAAFSLFAELSGRGVGMQILFEPRWGGGAYREDHLQSTPNWYSFELDKTRTRQLHEALQQTLARPGLLNPAVRLRTPDQHLYQQALVEQVRQVLTKKSDAQLALQNVARRWKELDAAKDEKKRFNDYRLSLGLSALP